MSVPGVSPRPYTSSFSGTPSSRRAGSPARAMGSPSSYNSILLDQCSIRSDSHHQLFCQATKAKDTKAMKALQTKVFSMLGVL